MNAKPWYFTCDSCGERCESTWTEEEARAEAIEAFGAEPADKARVCDFCYQVLMEHFREDNPKEKP